MYTTVRIITMIHNICNNKLLRVDHHFLYEHDDHTHTYKKCTLTDMSSWSARVGFLFSASGMRLIARCSLRRAHLDTALDVLVCAGT